MTTKNTIRIALIYGSLWGMTEATLGYLLHLANRTLALPGLAGFVMFPAACFFLYRAFAASGSPAVLPFTALAAAATKLASAFHPAVAPIFVVNPALAILAEGAVFWAAVVFAPGLFSRKRTLLRPVAAVAGAIGWCLLFLAAVFLLPVQKGILMKGSEALLYFLLVEGSISGIIAGLFWVTPATSQNELRERTYRNLTTALLPAAAVLMQTGAAIL